MAEDEDDPAAKSWHLDRRVPIALILMLIAQTFTIAWWASSTDSRITVLEKRMDATAPQADRLTRVEVKIESVQQGIAEIKRMIMRAPMRPVDP